jgi:hypothetical protein
LRQRDKRLRHRLTVSAARRKRGCLASRQNRRDAYVKPGAEQHGRWSPAGLIVGRYSSRCDRVMDAAAAVGFPAEHARWPLQAADLMDRVASLTA